jgi:hypothetical protein
MNNKLTPSKVISEKTLRVVANFTNGFAQNVIELEDGTVLFISYSGDEVKVQQTTPIDMDDPTAISKIVNATDEDA